MRAFPNTPGSAPRRDSEHTRPVPGSTAHMAPAASTTRTVPVEAAAVVVGVATTPAHDPLPFEGCSGTAALGERAPAHPDDSRAHGPLHRAALLAGASALLFSVAVVFAPSASAVPAPPRTENAGARTAVLAANAVTPDALALPADFAAAAGYRPAIESGLLVNPEGGCSSPVPLPAEFELACKAHDLGYDLLRYAGDHDQPLGPWARQALDTALDERMHDSCAARPNPLSRTRCEFMADVAATFVDLNSRRQDYGVPVHETSPFDRTPGPLSPAAGVALFVTGIGTAAALATRITRRNRTRPTTPEAPE
ncbi:hypothetical protein [Nocardia sp. NPDC057668]|uniref:hypothetical protein n=1 Tax=Nocardia sp. NPDC057668 TaxID=3346202 RepID=UPI0036724ED0